MRAQASCGGPGKFLCAFPSSTSRPTSPGRSEGGRTSRPISPGRSEGGRDEVRGVTPSGAPKVAVQLSRERRRAPGRVLHAWRGDELVTAYY